MRTITTALGALTFALGLAAPAGAQDRPSRELAPDVNYVFDDHEVGGGRYLPDGTVIHPRLRGPRTSLVRPRVHFVPEMLTSVENL
ncbi:MAG TPA: hypothetical protein VIL20_21460 [Sandaracinaceae bacterium]